MEGSVVKVMIEKVEVVVVEEVYEVDDDTMPTEQAAVVVVMMEPGRELEITEEEVEKGDDETRPIAHECSFNGIMFLFLVKLLQRLSQFLFRCL